MTVDLADLAALPDPLPIRPVAGPLDADVTVPGSKSITNRALVCAALAGGSSTLRGALAADDVAAMVGVLSGVGVAVEVAADGTTITVGGCAGRPGPAAGPLDVRQSGTTARFVPPLLALGDGRYEVTAHPQMQARPMGATFDALRTLGVTVDEHGVSGALPATVLPGARTGGIVTVPGDESSQFLSGLLLAGPCFEEGLTLVVAGDLVSRPYVDLTIAVMASFGAVVDRPDDRTFVVAPTGYRATTYDVEPDASAASYPLAAAAICGGRVRVLGLGPDALQGDAAFADLLGAMGASVTRDETGTEVRVERGTLRGGTFDLTHVSDTAPTLACVAPFASDPVVIEGIGFIRRKEIDRVAAVVGELRRCGIEAVEDHDGWTIGPGTPNPAVVETYEDHRMAMSFSLLGLVADGIAIAGPDCVAKTFPGYWTVLDHLTGGSVDPDRHLGSAPVSDEATATPTLTVIAIDGPAGSGKSTVGKALAQHLGLQYLDTGAMYRGVTFAAIRRGIDPADADVVARLAEQVELTVADGQVIVDGVDATIEIRGPEVTRAVSLVAANPAVRVELVRRQREWAAHRGGGVLEGRDIGSVVFPDATLKVYLDASPEVRASRRSKEVTDLSYETVAADIARRDALDQGRASSPLTVADGAVQVDTSDLGVAEIVARLTELVEEARS
jgi:3-phosphoshikimate 1-carboxyvinyltransferase